MIVEERDYTLKPGKLAERLNWSVTDDPALFQIEGKRRTQPDPTITAANGDTITLAGTGTSCPTSPTTADVTDTATVTGGTGRFAGASGTITVRATVDRAAPSASVTYVGTLSTPGSIK